ncbi:hypothetical protein KKA85_00080, partial [bacterium]|nr:hypothetical protein [bacterium]MBU1674158.1 hypothetical protein [bacterium]
AADPATGAKLVFSGGDLQASTTRRHFVAAPAGATAMRCRLEVSGDVGARDGAGCYLEICDPEGAVQGDWAGYARPETSPVADTVITAPGLRPGIWEMNVVAAIGNLVDTNYRLTVSFDAYDVRPAEVTALARRGAGEPAVSTLTVTRAFPGVFKGEAVAEIAGFGREREIAVEQSDEWSHAFKLDAVTPRARFHLALDEATANLFTDCAVNVLDADGHAARATGFDGLVCDLDMSLPAGTAAASYTLKVIGGFALGADAESWGFDLSEEYLLAAPVAGEVSRAGGGDLHLHCGVPTELEVSFGGTWPAPPDSLLPIGAVEFRDLNLDDRRPGDRAGRLVLAVPIRLAE